MGNAEKIVGFFPKGSTTGKTKANPQFGKNRMNFAKDAKALKRPRVILPAAAKAGNDAA